MRLVAIAIALACAGCGAWKGRRVHADCHERVEPGAAAPGPIAIPPADPQFEQLRGYRNYYAVQAVTAYEHRFAVWFTCVEQSVSYYAIGEDGTVRDAGGAWGGLAVRGDDVAAVPEAQRANAAKIAAEHEADYVGASAGRIEYLGSYREVRVTERIPDGVPGDPYARMARHATVRLRANADLTAFEGIAGYEGGESRLCWKDLAYGDCGPQHWIDFTPAHGLGEPQLPALVSPGSPQPDDERARFLAAALAGARAKAAGEPGASLDAILAAQGDTRLPAGFAPPVVVAFTIYGRVARGEQPSGVIRLELPPVGMLSGRVGASTSTTVGGVTFTATASLETLEYLSVQDGVIEARGELRYELTDGRGARRDATVPVTLEAITDGDAAVITALALPEAVTQAIHDPPSNQELPGAGDVTSFDLYLGVSARRDAWYPGS